MSWVASPHVSLPPFCVCLCVDMATNRLMLHRPQEESGANLVPADETHLSNTGAMAAPRLIIIGDVHGDIAAFRRALHLAGAIDAAEPGCVWRGGALRVVQTGDQLDRGNDELAVVACAEALHAAAPAAGGSFDSVLGNHELMNVVGDFSFVFPDALAAFANLTKPSARLRQPRVRGLPAFLQPRAAALFPGGPLARVLATRPVFLTVGRTLVVHGGVLPVHVATGLAAINARTSTWLRGDASPEEEAATVALLFGADSPLWTRAQALFVDDATCSELSNTLAALDVDRVVVGHTPQAAGVSRACGGRVWRVDTGMSESFRPVFSGAIELLQIVGDKVTILRE
jgi:hypothetical protein